ncbi:hypothetical protein QWY77_10365 [Thalassotalea ponticola]|uniref:hypothetical protein n=1 Tax=Thalassotalea ponticola TaxID=1523392 RepID=UPI0025B602B7|nr:hypothetical protein [Thalassotalea ponticola]MDN3653154.1 hypothetical protein [Thalassotalea ponticola]
MHWNLNNLNERVSDNKFVNDTICFFAHEVAHLYQNSRIGDIYGESDESWLHEGHADWLAASALQELYPDTREYVANKIDRYRNHCAKGLRQFPLVEAADKGRFDLYYSCGLLIHQAIDLALQKHAKKDIYSLWVDFRKQAETGDTKGSKVFLAHTEKWTSKALVNRINEVIESKLSSPENTLNQLATSK